MSEPIGAVIHQRRLGLGYSQQRLADLLCGVSGVPTVTRVEVSRWERAERVPGEFWLGWLAVTLELPVERLVAAAARSGRGASARSGRGVAAPSGRGVAAPSGRGVAVRSGVTAERTVGAGPAQRLAS